MSSPQRETWHPARKTVEKPPVVSSGAHHQLIGSAGSSSSLLSSSNSAKFGHQRSSHSSSPPPESTDTKKDPPREPADIKITIQAEPTTIKEAVPKEPTKVTTQKDPTTTKEGSPQVTPKDTTNTTNTTNTSTTIKVTAKKQPEKGSPVWSCSTSKMKARSSKQVKFAPVLGERRRSNAPPPRPISPGGKKTFMTIRETKRKSTRRSVRKSMWMGNSPVNDSVSNSVGVGIEPFPGIPQNRRFDEVSARILEEAYKEESVFARCSELLKTWFHVPLLAALGPRAKESIAAIFCGVDELESQSRKVLVELGAIARSGRPFLLGETFGECEDYLKAHEKFIGGHRAALSELAKLMHSDPLFEKFLGECSRACGGVNIFDLFWVILQRFTTICKLAVAHNTLINTVNSVHSTINSCNAFFSAHAPFQCETTCYRVAKAGPTKPATAAGYARLLAMQRDAQSLCDTHASIATFRTIAQAKAGAIVPISATRRFVLSVPVILINNPFYGCITESPAEILAFDDGIALCRPLSEGPAPRSLIQWYPSNDLRSFAPIPEPVEWNDTAFCKTTTVPTKQPGTAAAAAALSQSGTTSATASSGSLGSEENDTSSLSQSLTGSSPSGAITVSATAAGTAPQSQNATGTSQTRRERKFSFVLTLANATNPSECMKYLRATSKDNYTICERAVLNATDGKHEIETVSSSGSGDSYSIFGRDLESLLAREQRSRPGLTVPILPQRLCHYVIAHCLAEQGVFRVAAGKRTIDALYKRINSGELNQVNFGEESPHLAPSLLKTFFRDLPGPLIPQDLYSAFIAVGALDGIEANVKAEAAEAASRNKRAVIKDLINRIPKPNRDLLTYVMAFFSQVAANKHSNCMDAGNLAIVTAPNILYLKDGVESFPNISNANNVVSYMIANYNDLFDPPRRSWMSFKRKLVGHPSEISAMCVAESADGARRIVSADKSGKCYVWNEKTATYNSTFDLPSKNVTASLGISNTIWVATEDGILILDSANFTVLNTIKVNALAFAVTEDKREVWCGSHGKVVIVSVAEQRVIAELPAPDDADIYTLVSIPDTDTMWSAGCSKTTDKFIYVWDTSERYVMGQFPAHKSRINSIAVIGTNVWTSDDDGLIYVWNGDTGKFIRTVTHHTGPVYGLCALGDQVWSCSRDRTICAWDPETFDFIAEIRGYHVDSIVGFLPVKNGDSVDVWSYSKDKSVCVWNVIPRSEECTYMINTQHTTTKAKPKLRSILINISNHKI